jgi:serine/threonine protein kinase
MKLLVVDPKQRLTCQKALEHPWFKKFNTGNDEKINLNNVKTSGLKNDF